MATRFEDALIAQAACNPAGLANSLIRWQREIMEAGGGTEDVRRDPACRLLVYQLAYLMGVEDLNQTDYATLYLTCEQAAQGQPH